MVRSRTPSQGGGSQGFEMERKYSVPSNPDSRVFTGNTSEDLHAWSIYRWDAFGSFFHFCHRFIIPLRLQAKSQLGFHGQRSRIDGQESVALREFSAARHDGAVDTFASEIWTQVSGLSSLFFFWSCTFIGCSYMAVWGR